MVVVVVVLRMALFLRPRRIATCSLSTTRQRMVAERTRMLSAMSLPLHGNESFWRSEDSLSSGLPSPSRTNLETVMAMAMAMEITNPFFPKLRVMFQLWCQRRVNVRGLSPSSQPGSPDARAM